MSEPMTDPNTLPDPLAALREADAARTPGEWSVVQVTPSGPWWLSEPGDGCESLGRFRVDRPLDAAFVAACTRHLPALLAEVEKLRAEREKETASLPVDDEAISAWFELTYAQYLTVPRSILEAMPGGWQARMAECLQELDETFDWRPKEGRYWCRLKDGNGRFVDDPLMNYRRPQRDYIESLRREPTP